MQDSNIFWLALKVLLGVFALFNIYVSIRLVIYCGYTAFQKAWQLIIIWLIPVFGAILVHSLMVAPRHTETDHGFSRDDSDNPPGAGMHGI